MWMHLRCAYPKWLGILALTFSLILPATVQAHFPLQLTNPDRPTLAPLLKEVTPAVVNISVTGRASLQRNPLYDDPFFRRFFDLPDQDPVIPRQSVGSGVIVDARNGYVLTNHHVVANADEIAVTLQDRRRLTAELIGSDEGTDIALLRIDAHELTGIEFGDSASLEVGDFVIAIGNPFGLGQTVTSGIVSALGRSGINVEGYEDFIQTDASINPGNSGGALIDLDGRLIGINTAIIAPSGGNVGIGFAVPTHMAKAVMEQLLEYGEVKRGRLGITIQDVTPDLAQALHLDRVTGAVITQVEPESAAEEAGLHAGDIITAVDGQPVVGSASLRNLIGLTRVGDDVDITVARDGREFSIKTEIGEQQAATLAGGQSVPKLRGAEFRNLQRTDQLYGEIQGVVVAQVEQGSPAWRNGLRENDIILAVNRRPAQTVDALAQALQRANGTVALNLLRGNARLFLVIR